MADILGFINIGSDSVRLAVCHVSGRNWYPVDEEVRVMRLESAVDGDGNLPRAALAHLAQVLQEFVHIGQAAGASRFLATAAAAFRQAKNQADVLAQLHKVVGLNVEVIQGEEEATLGVTAALNTLDVSNAVVVDIGGGSTELTLVKGRKLLHTASLPVGAVNLTDQFVSGGETNPARVTALLAAIDQQLATLPWLTAEPGLPLVGLGGTHRALGQVHQHQVNYPIKQIHNYRVPAADLQALYSRLATAPLAERVRMPGLAPDRADIIVAGAAIVARILSHTQADPLVVCAAGVPEGLVMREAMPGEITADVLQTSVQNLAVQFGVNPHAGEADAQLALGLYQQLTPLLLDLPERAQRLLAAAALLHPIGLALNFGSWEKSVAYPLRGLRLFGVSHPEQVMVAAIAGAHTDHVKEELARFASVLPADSIQLVQRLGVVFALAHRLNRAATQPVQAVQATVTDQAVTLQVQVTGGGSVDAQAVLALAPDFAQAFGRELRV